MKAAKTMRLSIEVAILATGLIVWITVHGLLVPTWTGSEVLIALVFIVWIAGWRAGLRATILNVGCRLTGSGPRRNIAPRRRSAATLSGLFCSGTGL